jgi:hypothetical protein
MSVSDAGDDQDDRVRSDPEGLSVPVRSIFGGGA